MIKTAKKGNARECSNYHTIALISHASNVMLKILQARLQQYMNRELPDVHACFRKGRGTRDQIANICWIMEKAREFQENIYFCSRKGDPFQGPKLGSCLTLGNELSEETRADKARDFTGKGHSGGEQQGKEPRTVLLRSPQSRVSWRWD